MLSKQDNEIMTQVGPGRLGEQHLMAVEVPVFPLRSALPRDIPVRTGRVGFTLPAC